MDARVEPEHDDILTLLIPLRRLPERKAGALIVGAGNGEAGFRFHHLPRFATKLVNPVDHQIDILHPEIKIAHILRPVFHKPEGKFGIGHMGIDRVFLRLKLPAEKPAVKFDGLVEVFDRNGEIAGFHDHLFALMRRMPHFTQAGAPRKRRFARAPAKRAGKHSTAPLKG